MFLYHILYAILLFPTYATCSAHRILPDLIRRITPDQECNFWSSIYALKFSPVSFQVSALISNLPQQLTLDTVSFHWHKYCMWRQQTLGPLFSLTKVYTLQWHNAIRNCRMETKCCSYKESVSILSVQTTAGAERPYTVFAPTVVTGVFKRICLGLKTSTTSNIGYYNSIVAERTGVQACRQLQSLYSSLPLWKVCHVQAGVLVQYKLRYPFVCRQRFFSVSVMATQLAGRSEVRFRTRSRDFSLLQNVHIGRGAHRVSYSAGSVGSLPAAAHSPTPVPRLIMNGVVLPLPPQHALPMCSAEVSR
jgi:hypothetical protein